MTIGIVEHNYRWQINYKTYEVRFFDKRIATTVTENYARVSDWISQVKVWPLSRAIVGLDLKWCPYDEAVLQLCIDEFCLIFQFNCAISPPQILHDFFCDYEIIFAGVRMKQKLEKLSTKFGIGKHTRYLDLGDMAVRTFNRNALKKANLKKLSLLALGKEVETPQAVKRSAWGKPDLTAEQVKYASVEAFLAYKIATILDV